MKCYRKGSSDANVEFGGCCCGGERVLVSMVSVTGCVYVCTYIGWYMLWLPMVVNQKEGIEGFNDVVVVGRTATWLLSKVVTTLTAVVMVEDQASGCMYVVTTLC